MSATRERVAAVVHAVVRLTSYVNAPDELSADVAVVQLQRGLADGVVYLDQRMAADSSIWWPLPWSTPADRFAPDTGPLRLPDAPAVIVAVGGPAAVSALVGHEYPAAIPSFVSSLDLGLRQVPPHRFVIGVDEPIYLSDHGRPAGMTPHGAASVSLAEYLDAGRRTGPSPARGVRPTRAGIAADDVVEARYLHRMTTVTAIATAAAGGLAGRADAPVPDRPGVFVVGDWVGRRGHLADAVLASAEHAATAAVRHVERRTVLR